MQVSIRAAVAADADGIWEILEPIIRAGATYTLPRDLPRQEALGYWFVPGNEVFVAEDNRQIVGTYFLRPNQPGGGAHVANCGYLTAPWASGRGIARAMCEHSLDYARTRGFRSMQFNFVVSSNQAAVHLWQKVGFDTVGQLPQAFLHPILGYVDALVMYRLL